MVKVGDKVRVTSDKYPGSCPRGTICTVIDDWGGDGDINATIDGGDGFDWFFREGQYEPITEPEPEYDYAAHASQYGICITVEFADGDVVIFDVRKCQDD